MNNLVDKPCPNCIVSPCCTQRCREYAKFIYYSREFAKAGSGVERQITEMPYEKAIEFILRVERVYHEMKRLTISPCSSTR